MPLALILQETVYTLRWGAYHLEPWIHLVRVEELLIDRARGAFLTHWFGHGLPLQGLFVNVVIANLAALRAQYFVAARSLLPDVQGPNLLEPLAGIAGMLAGVAVSPTMVVLGIFAVFSRLGPLVRDFGWKVLLLPVAQVLAAGVIAPLLVPVAVLGSVWLVSDKPETVRQVYLALGSVACLLIAATGFLRLLSGPREAIGNPLLKAILGLFDRLAGLLPFVLAFVSVIISRVGPLIEPLAAQVAPFAALIGEVFDTASFLLGDIGDAIQRFWPAIADQIDFVLVQLSLVFPVFGILFNELSTNLSEQVGSIADKASDVILKWFAKNALDIAGAVESPFTPLMRQATISFDIAEKWLGSSSSAGPSGSSSSSGFPKPNITKPADFIRGMGGPPPGGLGAIAILADIDIKYRGALFGDDSTFSKAAREGVAAALRPTTVFQAQRGALARELGKRTPEEALAQVRTEQLGLRDIVRGVVGRILPQALRVEVHTLDSYFDKLDESLYRTKVEKRQDFPVQDLPDNGKLRPIVRRLVIRGIDVKRPDADTFQARLQDLLSKQAYPADAPSGLALMRS